MAAAYFSFENQRLCTNPLPLCQSAVTISNMPGPAEVIKPAIQHLIRGGFSIVVDEVRGSYRRRQADEVSATVTELRPDIPDEYGDLPPLDQTRIGDSLAPPGEDDQLPGGLFAVVVGMDYEKRILRQCVTSGRDTKFDVLIVGPPGSAKSLLLEELRPLPDTRYVAGPSMSPGGLTSMFVDSDNPPRILLIDEIDKTDPATLDRLLTIMDGTVTRVRHGSQVDEAVNCRIIAAANSEAGLRPALLTRFWIMPLNDYTLEERRAVIAGFLVTRRGIAADTAQEIANQVAERGGDTRDAAQIASVWEKDPELAHEMIKRLGPVRKEGP